MEGVMDIATDAVLQNNEATMTDAIESSVTTVTDPVDAVEDGNIATDAVNMDEIISPVGPQTINMTMLYTLLTQYLRNLRNEDIAALEKHSIEKRVAFATDII